MVNPTLFPDDQFALSFKSREEGILPSQVIREFVKTNVITADQTIDEEQIQPASIDLRLGAVAYQVSASFLPGDHSSVVKKIQELKLQVDEIDLNSSNILQQGRIYIVPLMESIFLPNSISAKANPRSTVGRLDIFVRLLTDNGSDFDYVPPGYKGKLYVEIVPRTFSIYMRKTTRVIQLRFTRGGHSSGDGTLRSLDRQERIVYSPDEVPETARVNKGLRISLDLDRKADSLIGFKAKRNAPILDFNKVNFYDPFIFWEPIYSSKSIVLNPDDFFILTSKERIRVPPDYAAEMVAFEPTMGELRVHYAGFFDPGFGYGANNVKGTPAVMEVRAHEIPFLIEDGQIIARLSYYQLLEKSDKVYGLDIGSSYQFQKITLSKQFKQVDQERFLETDALSEGILEQTTASG